MKTISKMMVAVIVAAAMCITPLFVIEDADAVLKEDKAGYSIEMKNPTADELSKYGVDRDTVIMMSARMMVAEFVNVALFMTSAPTVSAPESFIYTTATGETITSNSTAAVTAVKVEANKIKVEASPIIAMPVGAIDTSDLTEKQKAAVDAINEYMGTVQVGDKVVLEGNIYLDYGNKETTEFADVTDSSVVKTKETDEAYYRANTTLKLTVIKSDETSKSIEFKADGSMSGTMTTTYDYKGVAYKDLTPTDKCTVTEKKSGSMSGSEFFTVNGKDYDVTDSGNADPVTEETVADIDPVTDYTIPSSMKTNIDKLPASSGNVTVGKEYSDAESAYNSVKDEVVGGGNNNTVLIIVAVVVVLVIIGGAAFFFIKKKG